MSQHLPILLAAHPGTALLDIDQAAPWLGLQPSSIRHKRAVGLPLPVEPVRAAAGRRVWFRLVDIAAWLDSFDRPVVAPVPAPAPAPTRAGRGLPQKLQQRAGGAA